MRWLEVGWIAAVVLCTGALAQQCDVPVAHYKTMGCTAVGTVATTGCPERYDCPSLTAHDNEKCYFNGKAYAITETIPNELVAPFCSVLCYCRAANPYAKFRCAHIDCPEFFQRFDHDNCYRKYEKGSCCAAGKVCGEERTKLATCELEHEIYHEGQRMHLKDQPCRSCICKPGFNASATATDPNCFESACGFELFEEKQLYGGGIPVYKKDRCCPWEWRLPLDTDKVVKGSNPTGSKQQCKYGKLTLNFGDSLDLTQSPAANDDGSKLSCTCAIPPLVHCVLN